MKHGSLQTVIETVRKVSTSSGFADISADTELVDDRFALGSLSIVDLILLLEKAFSIELDASELYRAQALRTVGSLADFIEKKISSS